MDALVRFYEGEWAYLAKAEYNLRRAVLSIFRFQGPYSLDTIIDLHKEERNK